MLCAAGGVALPERAWFPASPPRPSPRLGECARYKRVQAYLTGIAVDLDPQTEGVENGAALLGIGVGQGLAKVGEGSEDRGGVLGVGPCCRGASLRAGRGYA